MSGKLEQDLQLKNREKGLLNELSQDLNSKYIQSDYLSKIDEELQSLQHKQELISRSQSIEDNCDIIDFGFETIYQENIRENGGNEVSEDTPAVLRYGLNKDILTAGSYIEKGLLHPYEIALFEKAIDYLNQTKSAEAYIQDITPDKSYVNNAVLVDIFDRSTGFVDAGDNQTHTVVLWKKTNDQIMLIDPSNINFSNHLCDPLTTCFFGVTILPSQPNGQVIYGTQGKPTGYSEYDYPNPLPRDCVDIAVKVAFEINEQQKIVGDFNLVEKNVFSQISNKRKLSKHLDKIDGTFIRELQSSNKDIRREAKQFLEDETTQFIAPKMQSEMRNLISIREAYQAYNTLFSKTKNIIPNTISKKK